MQLYNTLSRKVETFHTLDGRVPGDSPAPVVKLYACGPTVYDFTHIGHLRKYTMDDILIRTLRHAGYQVKHVQNITDVGHLVSDEDEGEDKMEKGARKYGQTAWDLAKKFEAYFFRSMDLMGNLRPTLSCRATDHIQSQLALVEGLEKKGYTYIIPNDGVYFDTSKLADYGKLAGFDPQKQKEGARVAKVEGKRNASDFALWKFERPGENRQMVWPSPWSERSFPGWHVECSAMSIEHLGPQLDIHTGGIDHIPVHHTDEIAQSEAYTGKVPFSQFWVHHNFLLVDGEKMSKSLQNFYTIDDLLEKGYLPRALRLLFLTSHYRSEQNFTFESLGAATKMLLRLESAFLHIQGRKRDFQVRLQDFPDAIAWRERFFEKMEKDLATPEALSVLWDLLRSDLDTDLQYRLLLEFDQVLGLNLAALTQEQFIQELALAKEKKIVEPGFLSSVEQSIEISDLPKDIQERYQERELARKNHDFVRADRLRQELENAGYQVIDEKGQSRINKIF